LAKREKKYITEQYNYIEDTARRQVKDILNNIKEVDAREDFTLEHFVRTLCLILGNEDEQFVTELMHNDYKRMYLLHHIKSSIQYREAEPVRRLVNDMEKFEESRRTRKKANEVISFEPVLDVVNDRDNDHTLRAAFIRTFVWDVLNLVIQCYHKHANKIKKENFIQFYSKCKPAMNIDDAGLDPKLVLHDMVMTFIRLVTDSLFIGDYFQFIYYGKERSPFLSSLFYLTNAQDWLDTKHGMAPDKGKSQDAQIIRSIVFMFLQVLHLVLRKKIPVNSLKGILRKQLRNNILTDQYAREIDASKAWLDDRCKDLEIHEIESLLRMYRLLTRYGIVTVDENKIHINTYSHNYREVNLTSDKVDDFVFKHILNAKQLVSGFYGIMDMIRGQIQGRLDALVVNDICVIDEMEDTSLKTDRSDKCMVESSKLDGTKDTNKDIDVKKDYRTDPLYVRRKPTKAEFDGLTPEEKRNRKGVIKHYAEKYHRSQLSGEIAIRINRKLAVNPPASEFEVRGEKVAKTIKDKAESARIEEFESVPVDISNGDLGEEDTYLEGKIIIVRASKVERDPRVVKRSFEIHGKACQACGYSPSLLFKSATEEDTYGLQCHHKKLLSESGEIDVNPKHDTAILCAICHAFLHANSTKDKLMTIEELRKHLHEDFQDKKE
jgi:predicted HNH restriction endonuclease